MKKINNPNGSITYQIYNQGIGVQKTISDSMLKTLKNMPRTSKMSENWYEYRIEEQLILEWNEILRNNNRETSDYGQRNSISS